MDGQWYFQREGEMHGPVSTAELERLIQQRVLLESDLVQVVGTNDWLKVSEVSSMFSSASTEAESASEQAARLLAVTRPGSLRAGGGGMRAGSTGHHNRLNAALSITDALVSGVGTLFGLAGSAIESGLATLFAWRRSKWTLAVIGVLLASLLLRDFSFDGSLNQLTIDEMSSLWKEIDQFNGRQVLGADWEEFRLQSLERVNELERQLQDAARGKPILRSHYWLASGFREAAARGHLIQAAYLLQEILESPTRNEATQKLFTQELEKAHRHHIQSPMGPTVPKVAVSPVPVKSSWDPLSIGILVIDATVIVGFLGWFVARRFRTG